MVGVFENQPQVRIYQASHGREINEYLHEVDEECYERMELLVDQMKAGAGITEELKVSDQMKRVGRMNSVRSSVEEIELKELIYV